MKNRLLIWCLSGTIFFGVGACTSAELLQAYDEANKALNGGSSTSPKKPYVPSSSEAAQGLKTALKNGVEKGVSTLSADGAFWNDAARRILFPPEIKNIESKMRDIGLGGQVDKAVKSLNTAATKASASAKPIFVKAVSAMTFQDAMGILTGGKGAATSYLRKTTTDDLKSAYKPTIKQSLDQVSATKYWGDIINTYNKVPFITKVNPDLSGYVTDKATEAMFKQIEVEENQIRENPVERVSDILRRVFGYADTQKG